MKKIKDFNIRTDLSYATEEGFWLSTNGDTARIGMNPLVQETTGAFVAIRIENTGTSFSKGESFGSIEAEKHVGPLKAPLSGKIIAINDKVLENPRLINTDPYGKGWLIEIKLSNINEVEGLLSGDEKVTTWFESEIARYEQKGWLAERVN
ncbi:MAG TPA: glycine cleavage system protein H [Bacteroidetes bacterium]|nr:glycine cleavage system protein H [Bacteroidota bacterium]